MTWLILLAVWPAAAIALAVIYFLIVGGVFVWLAVRLLRPAHDEPRKGITEAGMGWLLLAGVFAAAALIIALDVGIWVLIPAAILWAAFVLLRQRGGETVPDAVGEVTEDVLRQPCPVRKDREI